MQRGTAWGKRRRGGADDGVARPRRDGARAAERGGARAAEGGGAQAAERLTVLQWPRCLYVASH